MKSHVESPEKRLAQHTLAHEFVELVHGRNAADDAEAQHRVAFSGKLPLPPAKSSSKKEQPTTAFTMPSHHVILPRSLITTQALSRILVSAGLTKSRSESHQLMTNNGVSIGSRSNKSEMGDDLTFSRLTNWTADKNANYIIDDSLMIIRVGKWKLKIIKVVSDEEFEKQGLVIPEWPLAAPEETWQEKPEEVEAHERLKRFNAHNLKQRLERLETFKEEGVVGPGMSARHMKQRLSFKKHEAKKKRKLERWNGGVEEEELTEAEKEEIKRKEVEFWKDVKL
jgi:tyrosyl-tRNA synthetase